MHNKIVSSCTDGISAATADAFAVARIVVNVSYEPLNRDTLTHINIVSNSKSKIRAQEPELTDSTNNRIVYHCTVVQALTSLDFFFFCGYSSF